MGSAEQDLVSGSLVYRYRLGDGSGMWSVSRAWAICTRRDSSPSRHCASGVIHVRRRSLLEINGSHEVINSRIDLWAANPIKHEGPTAAP